MATNRQKTLLSLMSRNHKFMEEPGNAGLFYDIVWFGMLKVLADVHG